MRIDGEEILWWRHLSRRRKALVLRANELRRSHERTVAGVEAFWVNQACAVIVCDAADGTVEFAVLHDSDRDDLRQAISSS